jgi:hypothetical protein
MQLSFLLPFPLLYTKLYAGQKVKEIIIIIKFLFLHFVIICVCGGDEASEFVMRNKYSVCQYTCMYTCIHIHAPYISK